MSAHPSPTPMAPSSDDILAALDPEQRQVATSPSGPMCVLAGAGTGKTRAITHRIAYGVHSRCLPAAAGPRGDLHRAGGGGDAHPPARARGRRGAGPHLPRRGAASAALLLAAGDRWCRTGGAAAQGLGRRRGRLTAALPARPDDRARPRLRGRVGQGQHADPRDLPRRRPPSRTRPGRAGRHRHGAAVPDLRGGQGRAGRDRLRGRAAGDGRHPHRARGHRPHHPQPVPPLRGRRVPGRQRRAAAAARPVGRRA